MLRGLQSAKIETACHIFHVPSTFKPVEYAAFIRERGGLVCIIITALHEAWLKIQSY